MPHAHSGALALLHKPQNAGVSKMQFRFELKFRFGLDNCLDKLANFCPVDIYLKNRNSLDKFKFCTEWIF